MLSKARSNQVQILKYLTTPKRAGKEWSLRKEQGREDSKVYFKDLKKKVFSKPFKSTNSIGRILNLQGCKLVCLGGNPNEHFDKSYDTERCPEVDHVEHY